MISRIIDWLNSGSDRRSVPREPGDGLLAFFWEGEKPQGHAVLDISRHGAYIANGSISWSRGTQMILTLQMNSTNGASPDAIVLQAEVVRAGRDGMALRFVFPAIEDRRKLISFLGRWKRRRGDAPLMVMRAGG